MHLSDQLRERLPQPGTSVHGMTNVPWPGIAGLAFFPGGDGTWRDVKHSDRADIPPNPIMLLGQDFGRVSDFDDAFAKGEENRTVDTWKKLISLLRDADIPPASCFFTNAIMGLRTTKGNTGASPGYEDHLFLDRCAEFLRFQIQLLRPTAVVTLGEIPLAVLALVCPSLVPAAKCPSFIAMDKRGLQFQPSVALADSQIRFMFAACMHPAAYSSDVARRTFQSHSGRDAHVAMLRIMFASRPDS